MQDQWRVLSIEPETGIYRVGIWRMPEGGTELVEVEFSNPVDARGTPFTEIPFEFVGAENNDDVVDIAPLDALASLNVAHYRNAADYEESCFMVGQPTPVIAGLTQAWKDANFKNGIQLGSRAGIALPVGGSASLLQAAPNTMPKEAMEIKERQMVALGAKLIEQTAVQRTATEARQEYATEISVLGTCARNVASAYVDALKWCGMFAGTDEVATFELTPDFELGRLTSQELHEIVLTWQGKGLAWSEFRTKLRSAGLATLDDEKAKAEIEATVDFAPGSFDPLATPPNGQQLERMPQDMPDGAPQ
jgi:hypothetical protein